MKPKQSLKAKFQPNWLSQRAVQKKEAIALIFKSPSNPEAESWTYSQLEHDVNDWAERLQALGLKSGDRVGLLLSNHPRYIIIVHALVKCEAIAVFLNIRLTVPELHWQIEDSHIKYLVCDEFTQSTANSLEQQFDNLNLVVINSHSQKSGHHRGSCANKEGNSGVREGGTLDIVDSEEDHCGKKGAEN